MLIQIITTSDKRDELENIATRLVKQRLAACCQIDGPITSIYSWNDNVESAEEFRCTIKTLADNFDAVKSMILELHSYQQPQIVSLKIEQAEPGFQQWVETSVDVQA
ncbi:MAG: divalent-cation tolerance protein CutA [Planctomycetota bacterium]